MDEKKIELRDALVAWLQTHFPEHATMAYGGLVVLWIAVVAGLLHFILHGIVLKQIERGMARVPKSWQRALYSPRLFSHVAFMLQGVVVHIQARVWLESTPLLREALQTAVNIWFLIFGLLALFSVLDGVQNLMRNKIGHVNFPFRGVIQTVKLITSVLVGILSISILMGESPLILLSGLGALSAVLMLVFKDPLLGLVAGIQLTANKMLSVGDWLEMPKYGADGDVMDIGLTTVKVQNWDKTITTIPTYALISDSFKNWRGMSEAGGRRIKRSILINTSSIGFLSDDDLERLKKSNLLGGYLSEKLKEIERTNKKLQLDMTSPINGRRLTNIGTLRGYLHTYLKEHPQINQNLTLMVRQLASSSEGLPIEIYAFTSTTKWTEYEDIQSDIFDHIFAVLPEFNLRAHEAPTGADLRALSGERR